VITESGEVDKGFEESQRKVSTRFGELTKGYSAVMLYEDIKAICGRLMPPSALYAGLMICNWFQ